MFPLVQCHIRRKDVLWQCLRLRWMKYQFKRAMRNPALFYNDKISSKIYEKNIQWSTFSLYYKLDILRLFYKANNDSLPEPLMKSILDNSSHGYSLRGKQLSSIPRFNSRFMKDSLRYKGSVLWNIVKYHNQQKSFSSFLELRKHVVNRAYFKDFNFNALSASTTRHRHSDFIYN